MQMTKALNLNAIAVPYQPLMADRLAELELLHEFGFASRRDVKELKHLQGLTRTIEREQEESYH